MIRWINLCLAVDVLSLRFGYCENSLCTPPKKVQLLSELLRILFTYFALNDHSFAYLCKVHCHTAWSLCWIHGIVPLH